MKINKYIKLVSITCLLFLSFSCDDFLTFENPDNKTVPAEYYNSGQEVEQAVIGVYVKLRRALLSNYAWLMYGEARTGDLTVNVDFYQEVNTQLLTADEKSLEQIADWEYFYDVINDANQTLQIIENANDDVLTHYEYDLFKGEMLALKSMAYFYIARIWGDVPSAESNSFGQLLDENTAVELALSFATEAHTLLPWVLLNTDGIVSRALTAVRFNKTAVIMLLAQQNLWLGNANEAYVVLSSTTETENADSLSSFGLSTGDDAELELTTTPLDGSMVNISIHTLDAIYPEGDGRRESMFSISEDDGVATLIVPDNSVLQLYSLSNLPLLLSEAAWKNSNLDEAKAYMVAFAIAVGATEDYSTLTEDTFEDALLMERQRSLIGSGQCFFDVIRFNWVASTVPEFSETDVQNGAIYWPLSQASIQDNNLSQITYWSN